MLIVCRVFAANCRCIVFNCIRYELIFGRVSFVLLVLA